MGLFNLRIKKYREECNLSQEDLAEKLRVSRQTLYNWEKGYSYPNYCQLCDMRKIFDISYGELMGDEDTLRDLLSGAFEEKDSEELPYWKRLLNDGFENGLTDIAAIKEQGRYQITTDDIMYFVKFLHSSSIATNCLFAMRLSRAGLLVIDIWDDGISIFIHDEQEANKMKKEMMALRDIDMGLKGYGVDDYEDYRRELFRIEEMISGGSSEAIAYAKNTIFGTSDDLYCVIDKDGNICGKAKTKDECDHMAKNQGLEKYTIKRED